MGENVSGITSAGGTRPGGFWEICREARSIGPGPRRAVGEGPERVESILLLRVVDSEYLFGVVRIAAKKRGPGKMPGPEF